MVRRFPWRILPVAVFLLIAPGCADPAAGLSAPAPLPLREAGQPRGLLVVGSDYLSTSIAVINPATGEPCGEGLLHSGSVAPGLNQALSGDVTLPSTFTPGMPIALIDRYPASVLTFIDPDQYVVRSQASVASGFNANPHDLLFLDPTRVVVTRYERNPLPGRQDFDNGDDLAFVDLATGRIDATLPLTDQASAQPSDLLARPDRLAWTGGLLWVSCNHLSRDWGGAGEGLVVAVDAAARRVVHRVTIPGLANCGGMAASGDGTRLYVACSGLLAADGPTATSRSGLALLRLDAPDDKGSPTTELLFSARDLGDRPLGFDLALLGGRYLFFVRFGDLASGEPDRLMVLNLADVTTADVHVAATPYGLGGFIADDEAGQLYVGDADPSRPRVCRYRLNADAVDTARRFTLDACRTTHPQSGLPPRHLGWY